MRAFLPGVNILNSGKFILNLTNGHGSFTWFDIFLSNVKFSSFHFCRFFHEVTQDYFKYSRLPHREPAVHLFLYMNFCSFVNLFYNFLQTREEFPPKRQIKHDGNTGTKDV